MSEPFLGEIQIYAFGFAPRGWGFCNGQVLQIAQNQGLFSLLGTFYGGNGTTTFALPNLQGRAPTHQGIGPGLSPYVQGQAGGTESVTVLANQLPAHNHTLGVVANTPGNQPTPGGNHLGVAPSGLGNVYGGNTDGGASFNAVPITGGTQPHSNLQPYLTLNFCIALQGIFPPR